MELIHRVDTLEREMAGEKIRHDRHDRNDDERFAALTKAVEEMNTKLMDLWTARAEQVGAAKAIAELAEHRATRNTRIVSCISAITALLTLLIQKHWLGL